MNNENEEMIRTKVEHFLTKKIKVHISKKNKQFLNGIIIARLGYGIYLFKDEKLGEIELFISEIFDINSYSPRRSDY